jgi:imidazole glycerol phosphate synthase glutamine amidotransferase subunit
LAQSAAEIESAKRVVLPGVGSFAAAMEEIDRQGWSRALISRLEERKPTLCICLGLQLLYASSDESPGVGGLSIIDSAISRLPNTVIVPHMGWNEVRVQDRGGLVRNGHAYFANSFRATYAPGDWTISRTDYGGEMIAALESGPVVACQFHPELSGEYGLTLLEDWLAC